MTWCNSAPHKLISRYIVSIESISILYVGHGMKIFEWRVSIVLSSHVKSMSSYRSLSDLKFHIFNSNCIKTTYLYGLNNIIFVYFE